MPLGTAAVAARAELLRPWSGQGRLLIYELLDAAPIPAAAKPLYYVALAALILASAALFLGLNRRHTAA